MSQAIGAGRDADETIVEVHQPSRLPASIANRLHYVDLTPVDENTGERRSLKRFIPFLLLVALPVLSTAAYYAFYATPLYLSQSQFIIREGGTSSGSGWGALIASGALTRNDDNSHAISEYIQSNDAVTYLVDEAGILPMLDRPDADVFTRFPSPVTGSSRESLRSHLERFISIDFDTGSGIATLDVLALDAQDAQRLNEGLLVKAETIVNQLNNRARNDAITFATSVVAEGEAAVTDVMNRLTEFRNSEDMIDPTAQSTASLQLMTQISQEMTSLDTEIAAIEASAPRSPRLRSMRVRREAMNTQIETYRASLVGTSASLAPRLTAYERLQLERDLAVKTLTASYLSLEKARQDATVGRLYLQRIAQPNVPDRADFPKGLRNTFILLLICYCIFWIFKSFMANALDRTP